MYLLNIHADQLDTHKYIDMHAYIHNDLLEQENE